MKLIMEGWRKFVKEEESDQTPTKPTKVGLSPQVQVQQKKILQDLIAQDYVPFVRGLQKRIKDSKFRQFLNMGIEDKDMQDDVIEASTVEIPVKALRPTQKEIGLADSLGWVSKNNPTQAGVTAKGGVADVGGPIITANGKYIVDGHHRWSQVYLLNPDASIPAINFQIQGNPDAKQVLKLTQLAIAAVDRVVPMIKADAATDIYRTNGDVDTIRNIISKVVSDKMAQSLMAPYGVSSKDEVINKIVANAVQLYKKHPSHNPDVDRVYMPQLDAVSPKTQKIAKLKGGDINWNPKA